MLVYGGQRRQSVGEGSALGGVRIVREESPGMTYLY